MTTKKETPSEATAPEPLKEDLDSLGQDNPARALERANIEEAKKNQEEKDKQEAAKAKEA